MTDTLSAAQTAKIEKTARAASQDLAAAKKAIRSVIIGQDNVVDLALITLLSGGHGLLVGVPGLAKTLLVETLATVLGLGGKRVQFTPDLMPSDILGSEVLEETEKGKRAFRFIPGPIFCQLLMADEINRASPRTQSALLQAMQEKEITIAGDMHVLPKPFHVLATQNPIEQEGTYPLPEAQLDRFLMQINVDFPDEDTERQILIQTTSSNVPTTQKTLSARKLMEMQALVRQLPIGENVVTAILNMVRHARPNHSALDVVKQAVAWGPGPRAGQALMLATRARALLDGRLSPSIDDALALAEPVLQHRLALTFAARSEGITLPEVIGHIKDHVR